MQFCRFSIHSERASSSTSSLLSEGWAAKSKVSRLLICVKRVMGMAERGGKIAAQVIPDIKKVTLRGVVLDNVEPGSIVSTDELMSYGLLTGDGYKHGMVKHGSKEWSYYDYRHDAVHNTNRVESVWRLFKKLVASKLALCLRARTSFNSSPLQ
jgi:hypothetical protein